MSLFLNQDVLNNRVGFIHVPRTGGSSVRKWLITAYGKDMCHEQFSHYPLSLIPKEFLSDTIFTIVRNPYERMLSYYFYAYEVIKSNKDSAKMIRSQLQFTQEDLNKGFNYFCNNFIDFCIVNRSGLHISGTDTMSSYINHPKRNIDHILRYENLDKDFEIIQQTVGNHNHLTHKNSSKCNTVNYRDYYTPQSRMIVKYYHEEDLDLFGYIF